MRQTHSYSVSRHSQGSEDGVRPPQCIRSLLLAGIALALFAAGSAARADFVVNGGFEEPVGGGSFTTGTPPPGWVLMDGTLDIVTSATWPPFEGNQSAAMEGGLMDMSQTVTVPLGFTYTFSFAYANDPGGTDATADVLVTETGVGTPLLPSTMVSHMGSTVGDMDWTVFKVGITPSATGIVTINFQDNTSTAFGLALDAVSVSAPEPGSFLLCGIGAVGGLAVAWRRRKRAA